MITAAELRGFVEQNPNLVNRRESIRYPGLFVLKYHNRVFYDNLWNDKLQELRGLVVDADYNVIARPFTKIFNRFENGTDIPGDEEVVCVNKINGFLGCATRTEKYGLIVSTTGSLDSDFSRLAEKHLADLPWGNTPVDDGCTYMFEICDPSDPHIIKEEYGAYLIGIRMHKMQNGLVSESLLDNEAKNLGCLRPEWRRCSFNAVISMAKTCQHEGFVVYGENITLKIKSPYYLIKKLFARIRVDKISPAWLENCKQRIDEEYYPLVDYLSQNKDEFFALDEQNRLRYIEQFLEQ